MHPDCLRGIGERKRPLDQKESDIRDIFLEISEIKKQWEIAKSLDVSEEAKEEIKKAFENKGLEELGVVLA